MKWILKKEEEHHVGTQSSRTKDVQSDKRRQLCGGRQPHEASAPDVNPLNSFCLHR